MKVLFSKVKILPRPFSILMATYSNFIPNATYFEHFQVPSVTKLALQDHYHLQSPIRNGLSCLLDIVVGGNPIILYNLTIIFFEHCPIQAFPRYTLIQDTQVERSRVQVQVKQFQQPTATSQAEPWWHCLSFKPEKFN